MSRNPPIYYYHTMGCLGDRHNAYKQLSPPPSAIFHPTHVSFADYDIYFI